MIASVIDSRRRIIIIIKEVYLVLYKEYVGEYGRSEVYIRGRMLKVGVIVV